MKATTGVTQYVILYVKKLWVYAYFFLERYNIFSKISTFHHFEGLCRNTIALDTIF